MRTRHFANLVVVLTLVFLATAFAETGRKAAAGPGSRPQGPCDIYGAAGDPCVAAHSTTRALYRAYDGPLYQVLRQSDGKTLDIMVVRAGAGTRHQGGSETATGGYADAAAQDAFCANTYCWISKVYDQSPKHNDLSQAPRGGFSGPALGGLNNLPVADMAPVTVMGHKVYGVFIEPGMGLRIDDPRGTAVDDQAEGQYWVINGHHFNGGCCFDYGNAEIDSRDDDNGTMETAYFGDTTGWIHGNPPGPWIETDQENNLVGCVNTDGSRLCAHLPDVHWRFVTAMAKGEPHRWASLGGDAQRGPLTVMFDGQRVNSSYDPMRKQGAILLGNGGDNSNSSQGTFYEGAVTASGTFPTDATDQQVQANVVAAGYDVPRLDITAAGARESTGLQTFGPGAPKDTTVHFTNTTGFPVKNLSLSLRLPEPQWTSLVQGGSGPSKTFPEVIAPGASVTATFTVTAARKATNGDLVAEATYADAASGAQHVDTMAEKVRSGPPIRINEFRIGAGANATDTFLELFNAGADDVDLSNWSLTERPAQQAIFSAIKLASGTKLKPGGFYLLGLANSGLALRAQAGDATLHVRDVSGMSAGDTVTIGEASEAETRTIRSVGTAATDHTTVWQPLPDGPITLSPGTKNVPVQSVAGFKIGDKIGLGYGNGLPNAGSGMEQYEVATVTAVGKPGMQAYLAMDAPAGATSLQVTAVEDISVGDKIRLDIDSPGHGIETVAVTRVGTKASQTNLTEDVSAGATRVRVRRAEGFAVGDKVTLGTPASEEKVTVSAVEREGRNGAEITFTPALTQKHGRDEWVVSPGTGLALAAPLRFHHAANLPFSDRGTGVTFTPATRFVHRSDEPVQALGSGIVLDRPLANTHAIHAAVRDDKVTTAGYQGQPKPDQWFGGPELTTRFLQFGRVIPLREGSLVLRDASGVVIDSLNYGGLSDPWAAKGYQAVSGEHSEGCFAASPEPGGFGLMSSGTAINRSAGRYPDGADTDSNCADFAVSPATVVPFGASAGSTSLKVLSVAGFRAGQQVILGTGANEVHGVLASVGTAGATTTRVETQAGATTLPVVMPFGFAEGQTVTIGSGADAETATVASIRRFEGPSIVLTESLKHGHAAGATVAGTGLTLASGLPQAVPAGAQVSTSLPTPGAPNAPGRVTTARAEP